MHAPEHAEKILRHCVHLQKSGLRKDVAPNEWTFSAVIHSWAVSGRPDALEHALGVLDLMHSLYQERVLPKEKLTSVFNSLIVAIAKNMNDSSVDKAFDVLKRMKEVGVPQDAATHNCMMTVLLADGRDGPQQALEYFQTLESEYQGRENNMALDITNVNMALNAMAKGNRQSAHSQAMDLLERMMQKWGIEPNAETFNTVMKILSRSNLDDSAERCEDLLREMKLQSVSGTTRPSVVTYATCIQAWAYTRQVSQPDQALAAILLLVSYKFLLLCSPLTAQ